MHATDIAALHATFVSNEYGKLYDVLLCKPIHFTLQPINEIAAEYIRQGLTIDPQRVYKEHRELVAAIESTGTRVAWVDPDPAMPYQVFTRDIGVATRRGFLRGRFFRPVRQGEEIAALRALDGKIPSWQNVANRDGVAFEGGDFMYMDEQTVALGVGGRTNPAGAKHVQAIMAQVGVRVIPVPFEPRYLHLDMIFNVVGERVAVVCPQALPDDFLKLARDRGFQFVEDSPEGVFKLNCNLLAMDDGVVISPAMNVRVNRDLRSLGFQVLEVDLHDLLMGGGGPHCMTFPIRRASLTNSGSLPPTEIRE